MKKMKLDYTKIKPLSEASHTKGVNGRKVAKNNPSEWAFSFAACYFPRGAEFTIDEFRSAIMEAITYEAISILVDNGEAAMVLNDKNEIAFEFLS